MSIERFYKCNLCGSRHEWKDLRGVLFGYPHFQFRAAYDCENHLCEKCIQTIVNIESKDAIDVDADGFVDGMRPEGQ